MRAEYKTVVWSHGWPHDWISVFVGIGETSRELRRQFVVDMLGEHKCYEKARWYAINVCERYNRWSCRDQSHPV